MDGQPLDEDEHLYRGRNETETERLERNWSSLLQELGVVQTGVQVLTGFLLTPPFQQRFDELDGAMKIVYLATVCTAVSGMTVITFYTVLGMVSALVAGVVALLVFGASWLVLPLGMRRAEPQPPSA